MVISRSFRVLSLYDILANLLPGTLIPTVVIILFPEISAGVDLTSSISIGGFVIVSYVSGLILQAGGSWKDDPTTFGETLSAIRSSNEQDSPITITHVERSFLPMCRRKFKLPDSFEDDGKLMKLVLSYLETAPTNRALRFQALHSLYRSIWIASYLTLGLAMLKIMLTLIGYVPQTACVGSILSTQSDLITKYMSSPLFRECLVDRLVAVFACIGIGIFSSRKSHFDKIFVKYVFLDMYNNQITTANNSQKAG
ncbi:hypothetical protein MUK72_00595 [Halococcus dombrowskii]|uniref:Uncharacterized protein n=1 Tax=Halococcus dombrowskii TaxID=179637 RepID=A0AAX3ANA3_HALDO|nr:hypothetical protein [Halococcus dombrowskii]UOO95231.1 hypothetical protein MUK72_00595 [Halococcus dombrowskii]